MMTPMVSRMLMEFAIGIGAAVCCLISIAASVRFLYWLEQRKEQRIERVTETTEQALMRSIFIPVRKLVKAHYTKRFKWEASLGDKATRITIWTQHHMGIRVHLKDANMVVEWYTYIYTPRERRFSDTMTFSLHDQKVLDQVLHAVEGSIIDCNCSWGYGSTACG
jgi:hypothetical protein